MNKPYENFSLYGWPYENISFMKNISSLKMKALWKYTLFENEGPKKFKFYENISSVQTAVCSMH